MNFGQYSKEVGRAWLAGIIDGEGTIFYYMGGANKSIPVFRIFLVNSNVPMMEEAARIMADICGHSIKIKPKFYNKEKAVIKTNVQMYMIEICRQDDVWAILNAVILYLVAKKDKAEKVRAILCKHKKGTKWNERELSLISQIPVETEHRPPKMLIGVERQSELTGDRKSAAEMIAPHA